MRERESTLGAGRRILGWRGGRVGRQILGGEEEGSAAGSWGGEEEGPTTGEIRGRDHRTRGRCRSIASPATMPELGYLPRHRIRPGRSRTASGVAAGLRRPATGDGVEGYHPRRHAHTLSPRPWSASVTPHPGMEWRGTHPRWHARPPSPRGRSRRPATCLTPSRCGERRTGRRFEREGEGAAGEWGGWREEPTPGDKNGR
jgi:hypothetical protein